MNKKTKYILSTLSYILMFATLALLMVSTLLYYYYTYKKAYIGLKFDYLMPAFACFMGYVVISFIKQNNYKDFLSIGIKVISIGLAGYAMYWAYDTNYFGYYNYATTLLCGALLLDAAYYVGINYKKYLLKLKQINIKTILSLALLLTSVVTYIMLYSEVENIDFKKWNILIIIFILAYAKHFAFSKQKKIV